MMKYLRTVGLAFACVAALAGVAWAIQPGTTGTEKRFQQEAVKLGLHEAVVGTVTGASNAATLQGGDGIITTESLTTAAGATFTETLTNGSIAVGDLVQVTVGNGSNTGGTPALTTVTPAAGSVVIIVQNIHASAAFNGTLKIGFHVIKNSALNAD